MNSHPALASISSSALTLLLFLQPIRLETSPGRVELAILHMAEVDKSSYTDTRLAAMLDRSPIHALLFSRSGKILATNKAVIRKIQECAGGNSCLEY